MAEELYSLAQAAERLKLHPKTVLRHIRAGRLRARRIGKAYRIARSHLEAFAGVPAPVGRWRREPWIASAVEIPGLSPELARRWARAVTNALHARPKGAGEIRAEVVYEPERWHLRILVTGAPADAVKLLGLILVWLDQLRV